MPETKLERDVKRLVQAFEEQAELLDKVIKRLEGITGERIE